MSAASAATYTWSPGAADGGTGTWDTTLTNWNAGAVAWPTSGADNDATFAGTAGTVTISGGVTVNDISFQTGGYTVTGGTMTLNGTGPAISVASGSATLSSVIAGSNTGMVKEGAGTLVIDSKVTAGNTVSGTFVANGGTVIVIDTSGATPNIGFALANISAITLNNATMSLQGTQNALTTTARPVTINGGTLSADRNNAQNGHAIGAITLNGGALAKGNATGVFNFNGNVTVEGTSQSTISANVFLGSSARTFTVADAVTGTDLLVSGTVSGSGGATKAGVGTMELQAANTYTGTTTVSAGKLVLGTGGAFGSSAAFVIDTGTLSYANGAHSGLNSKPVTVRNGGVLSMENTGVTNWTPIGALTLQNGGTLSSTTTPDANGSYRLTAGVTVTGDATSAITTAIALGTSSGISRTFDVADGASATDLLVSGAIVDGNFNLTNNLVKTGAGTMELRAANSYKGETRVLGGRLLLGSGGSFTASSAFQADAGTLVIANNAGNSLNDKALTVQNGGVVSMENTSGNWTRIAGLTLVNGGTLATTGANDANGTYQLRGDVTVTGNTTSTIAASLGLRGDTGTRTFDVADGTAGIDLLVSSFIANGAGGVTSSLTKAGAGIMELRGTNTYTGTTTVTAGKLVLGTGGAFGSSAAFVIDTGTLSYANGAHSGLNSKPVTVRNGGVLSMENTGVTNWTPIGALTLQNGGTLSSTTTPDANGSYRLTADVTVTGDATSAITTAIALGTSSGISRTFDVADGASATDLLVSGVIVDGNFNLTNNLVKTGAGTMELRAANSYKGETRILGGRLLVGSGGSFTATSAFQADGGTLVIANNAGNALNERALTVQNGGVVSMQNTSSNFTRIGALTLVNGGTLSTTGANDANGTYQLRGDVTVTGNTTSTIAASLGLRGDTGTRTFDVADGTAGIDLLVSSFIANGAGGITSGLTKTGAGRMVLTGQNTYTGTTQVNAGSLIVNGSVGGNVEIAAGASLGGSGVLGRTLSGAGLVSVGNSPGIGTAGAVDPPAGTDWVFEITGTAPVWNSGTSTSVNDVFRLTDATPFATSLASGNSVDVLFALSGASPLVEGDYLGGFFIDNEAFDLTAALANGQFRYWVVGEYGSAGDQQIFNVGANGAGVTYSLLSAYDSGLTASYTVTQQTVNFGSGTVTGAVTQFVVVPEPASLGVAAIGIALAGWARARRRRGSGIR